MQTTKLKYIDGTQDAHDGKLHVYYCPDNTVKPVDEDNDCLSAHLLEAQTHQRSLVKGEGVITTGVLAIFLFLRQKEVSR